MDNKKNTGEDNSGGYNSGYRNSGDYNSGDRNSGYCNSGDCNSGGYNSGDRNSGYCNSGDCNSGGYNSGYRNSGDYNSGDRNSGDCNSGGYNSGYRNSGIFNSDEPMMRCFNKESNIKYSDWVDSDDYIYFDVTLNKYIFYSNMTDEQKKEYEYAKATGGALITLEYKEAWKEWWKKNKSEEIIAKIKRLPNFDASIFEEITGIKIDSVQTIKIGNREYDKSEVEEVFKNIKPIN
jgi:hypothetical protein